MQLDSVKYNINIIAKGELSRIYTFSYSTKRVYIKCIKKNTTSEQDIFTLFLPSLNLLQLDGLDIVPKNKVTYGSNKQT